MTEENMGGFSRTNDDRPEPEPAADEPVTVDPALRRQYELRSRLELELPRITGTVKVTRREFDAEPAAEERR
jgi:hypothetical protein